MTDTRVLTNEKERRFLKKWFALLLGLCLCLSFGASAEDADAPDNLSYTPQELHMAATGLTLYFPSDMDEMGGDEEAYDLGFRFNCNNDTFDFTMYVQDSRDMSFADYAAFYADRAGCDIVKADTINDFSVWRLTTSDNPNDFNVLIADPDNPDAPLAVYVLTFSCTGEDDVALAEEILGTLAWY
jgi:hypothetical protein